MAIVQTYVDKDGKINEQVQNIVGGHYGKGVQQATVTFSGAGVTTLADFGFKVTNWWVVGNDSGLVVKRVAVDNRYLHLQANGAGIVVVEGK